MLESKLNNKLDNKLAGFWAEFSDDHETAVEVSTMFCGFAIDSFTEIDSAIAANNNEEALRSLHTFKGTLAYLGFEDESLLAKKLELMVNKNGVDSIEHVYATFKDDINHLVALIKSDVLQEAS